MVELGGDGEIFHLQDGLARLGRFLVDHEVHVTAHHHPGQLFPGGVGNLNGADVLALAQDGAAVGHGHDLVELVGDEEDALALGGQVLHNLHQLVDLLRRQHSGGFIEDEDLIVSVQHFQDFRPLLHAHGDVLHQGVRVHGQTVFLGQSQHLFSRHVLLQETVLARFHTQDDVVQDGETFHQLKVLVHHPDAQIIGIVGVLDADHLAILLDGSLLRLVQPEEDAHQGGFPRAVLPQQRVDFALFQLEGDVVVGDDTGETLGDVQHFNGICLFQIVTTFLSFRLRKNIRVSSGNIVL